MNPDECAICFDAFTPDSGHSVLGCGHKFHMMCVVRWFQDQEGASTCPCCRREAGRLDNVPLVEEGDDEETDVDDETLSGWSGEEDEIDEDDDEDVGEIRPVWSLQAGGQWERTWVLSKSGVKVWDPSGEPEDVPDEMVEGAVALQRIWRGWRVRRPVPPPVDEVTEAAKILVTLSRCSSAAVESNWHYQRFIRVD